MISQGSTPEEFEKRLGAVLLAADPIIAIDNCERPLGGELLCQCLTQSTVKPRILGQSQAPETSTGSFITATGNNLVLAGDLTRRALLCRIDPKVERPEDRAFDRNPVAYAKANRPALVVAALTLLRAYHLAGRPGRPAPLGSFEAWSDLVRSALMWIGCADPVITMAAVRESDPKIAQLRMVMSAWREAFQGEGVTVSSVVKKAIEQRGGYDGREREFVNEDLREAIMMVAGRSGMISSRSLGKWLSEHKGRIVGGMRFEQFGERHGVAVWALVGAASQPPAQAASLAR